DGGDLALAEIAKCLQPPLTANKIISWARRRLPPRHRDRPLQSDIGNVFSDLPKHLLIADARIDHGYVFDRHHFNRFRVSIQHHATSISLARAAISKKCSRVSNRYASSETPLNSARRIVGRLRSSLGSR